MNIISPLLSFVYGLIDFSFLHYLCYGVIYKTVVSNPNKYSRLSNTMVRNIRYRYPITSEQITDTMDEVYNDMVDLLGYYNKNGDLSVSGSLRELWYDLGDDRTNALGYNTSGYLEALSLGSGTLTMTEVSRIEDISRSFFRNSV